RVHGSGLSPVQLLTPRVLLSISSGGAAGFRQIGARPESRPVGRRGASLEPFIPVDSENRAGGERRIAFGGRREKAFGVGRRRQERRGRPAQAPAERWAAAGQRLTMRRTLPRSPRGWQVSSSMMVRMM